MLDSKYMPVDPSSFKTREETKKWFASNFYRLAVGGIDHLGHEPNTMPEADFETADLRVLVVRLSAYSNVDGSMSHSLVGQICREASPRIFVDHTFIPMARDAEIFLKEGIPVLRGNTTKAAPTEFDIVAISNALSTEPLNFPWLWKNSGIYLFKNQRFQHPWRKQPILLMGGQNTAAAEIVHGYVDEENYGLVDCLIIGEADVTLQQFLQLALEAKDKNLSKQEFMKAAWEAKIHGFYEPDGYDHVYQDGKLVDIVPNKPWVPKKIKRSSVAVTDSVRTLEEGIIHYTGGLGKTADIQIASGCVLEGTAITLADGSVKNVENIQVGDNVITHDGSIQKVTKTFVRDVNENINWVKLASIKEPLKLTKEHPLLVVPKDKIRKTIEWNGPRTKQMVSGLKTYNNKCFYSVRNRDLKLEDFSWGCVHHLKKGWAVFIPTPKFPIPSQESKALFTPELVEFLGWYAAEGYGHSNGTLLNQVRIVLGTHELENIEKVISLGRGLPFGKMFFNRSLSKSSVVQLSFTNEYLANICVSSVGHGASTKRLSMDLMSVLAHDEFLARLFIKAFVAGDGYISVGEFRGDVEIGTSSIQLREQLYWLLSVYGIFSRRNQKVNSGGPTNREKKGIYYRTVVPKIEANAWWHGGKKTSFQANQSKNVWKIAASQAAEIEWVKERRFVGKVYNFETEISHSYLANCVSVHNCGGFNSCSFCRESWEAGSYRERSYEKVIEAATKARIFQGVPEINFYAFNWSYHTRIYDLIEYVYKKFGKVNLISQKADVIAASDNLAAVEREVGEKHVTIGVEGISTRLRNFLNKTLSEEQFLNSVFKLMKTGMGEIKMFFIATGIENDDDIAEFVRVMNTIEEKRRELNSSTKLRVSFTPFFASPNTPLQFSEAYTATHHGEKNLQKLVDYCVLAGTPITMSDGTVKNIESIVPGDYVLTHSGSKKKVLEVMSRTVSENILNVHVAGVYDSIKITKNHPVMLLDKEKVRKGNSRNKDLKAIDFPWKAIGTAKIGDAMFVPTPIGHLDGMKPIWTEELAEFLGWYAAEGTIAHYDKGYCSAINIHLGKHEESNLKYVGALAEKLRPIWDENKSSRGANWGLKLASEEIYERDSEQILAVYNPALAEFCLNSVGHNAPDKRLSEEVMLMLLSEEKLAKAFVKAFVAGDGRLYNLVENKRRHVQFNIAAKDLRDQIYWILLAHGILSRRSNGKNPGGPTGRDKEFDVYTLLIPKKETQKWWGELRLIPNVASRTRDVWKIAASMAAEITGIEEGFYEGQVYNLRVEDDESYLVDGVVVHNCSTHGLGFRTSTKSSDSWISQLLLMADRRLTPLLLKSSIDDGFLYCGLFKKDMKEIWRARLLEMGLNEDYYFLEKDMSYTFPWDFVDFGWTKQGLYNTYLKVKSFIGLDYCLSSDASKGHCYACGACPSKENIKFMIKRKIQKAPPPEHFRRIRKPQTAYSVVRFKINITDKQLSPVDKHFFFQAIARAFMMANPERHSDLFVDYKQHTRSTPANNEQRDWVTGQMLLDLSLVEFVSEAEIKQYLPEMNKHLWGMQIEDLKVLREPPSLRTECEYALYRLRVPNFLSLYDLQTTLDAFFRKKEIKVRMKVAAGKFAYRTEMKNLEKASIKAVSINFLGTGENEVWFAIDANLNPYLILEAMIGKKPQKFYPKPIECMGYFRDSANEEGEVDLISLMQGGTFSVCSSCKSAVEVEVFSGQPVTFSSNTHTELCIPCYLS